ncbi:MAG: LuxR C-terminal-related transcriptional regulator [Chloroflexi bacterium]|nr:LuxR C-terminal-related transcriptional regulator [Chloroflexota bacterium]
MGKMNQPTNKSLNHPNPESLLTPRQWEVLLKVAEGYSYQEAGELLGISERGVKYHMKRICQALGLKNRREAVRYIRQKQDQ